MHRALVSGIRYLVLLLVSASAIAQTARLSGRVTDAQDAAIVGAEVRVLNRDTAANLQATTNDSGEYSIPYLPVGHYQVLVSALGFATAESGVLSLESGQGFIYNIQLAVGAAKSEVSVGSGAPTQVETETAQVSGTITGKEVVALGLNGRNFTQLIALAPGVSNQTGQDEAKVGVVGSVKYSVNGGRVEYNTFEVDGSDVLNVGLTGAESTLVVYPSLDAIHEVKVLTSNYGAMYGRTASGMVLVSTKSGAPAFHGDVYEFLRNEVFNARNYFDQTRHAPLYRKNDFGGTIGGPLYIPGLYNAKKNKTFFFFSEEARLERAPEPETTFNQAVPTLAERSGDFNDVCPGPADPNSGYPFFTRADYPDCPGHPANFGVNFFNVFPSNNISSAGLIDRNADAILSTGIIPLPNATTGCNASAGKATATLLAVPHCYNATISPSTYWREELFRIDHNFNDKLRGSFTYVHDAWDTTVVRPQWSFIRNSFPTIQNRFVGPGTSLIMRLSQVVSPSLINEFSVSYTNSTITLTDKNGPGAKFQRPTSLDAPCGADSSGQEQCPIGYLFNNGFGGKTPGLVFAGNNAAYGGDGFAVDAGYMPWGHTNPTYSFADALTKQIGKHTLQFGAQFVLYQRNQTNLAIGAATGDVQGVLTYSNVSNSNSVGNSFADFLINRGEFNSSPPKTFQQDSAQARYYQRYQIVEPYIQDDWKVTPRLTLNLGVRFSLFGTYREKNESSYNWVPEAFNRSLAQQLAIGSRGNLVDANSGVPLPINLKNLDPRITNGLVQCGKNGVPAGCMKGHLFNPAPRVGFAWDPSGTGKTSIRGGYGIFFEHGTSNEANSGSLEGGAPLVLTMTQQLPNGAACIGGADPNCGQFGAFPLSVTSIPRKAVWPYAQQWSLSVQRQFPGNTLATFAYVGSKGTHLTLERQINQLAPVPATLNPFGPTEPILPSVLQGQAGDCNLGGQGFALINGVNVAPVQPAYLNLSAACFGVGGVQFPDAVRPFRGFNKVFSLENVANSSYHSFQTTVRRTHGPLTLGVSYTYSHSLDDSSDRSDTTFVNSFDPSANRASSNFDQRHLLDVSYIYQIPFSRGLVDKLRNWANDDGSGGISPAGKGAGVLEKLLAGWEVSGITVFQSGNPFSVINATGNSGIGVLDNAGVANDAGIGSYADVVKGASPPAEKTNPESIGPLLGNPAAFVAPRGLTFGNAGRNFLNNPHRLNFDVALEKHFKIRESGDLEFRAEAFNVFNHTQFRIYDPNLGNQANNTISCYGPGPFSAVLRSGAVLSSGPNLTGPNFSAAGGKANVMVPNPDGTTTTTLQQTDCLTGSALLHPVNAHRPRTVQFGLKFSF